MFLDKQLVVTPEEALTEIQRLMKVHLMKDLLSDKQELKNTTDRIQAVLDMREAYKTPTKKAVKSKAKSKIIKPVMSTTPVISILSAFDDDWS